MARSRKVIGGNNREVHVEGDNGVETLDLVVAPNGVLRAIPKPQNTPIDQLGDDDHAPSRAEMLAGLDQE